MEKFVEAEFVSHGVEVFSGDYDEGGHGECDIAVPTPEVLVFLELKKKLSHDGQGPAVTPNSCLISPAVCLTRTRGQGGTSCG